MPIDEALTFKSSAEGGGQSTILTLSAKKRLNKICKFRRGVILTKTERHMQDSGTNLWIG